MHRSRRWTELAADDGSASLEFLTVGLLLLVPTVYLVIALAQLQNAAFAIEGAARQATRVFVQADSLAAASDAAELAIGATLDDYGLDPASVDVRIACRPDPGECLTRRGFVTVELATVVPLPGMPPVLGLDLPSGIPLSATSTEQVSRFAGVR